MLRLSFLRSLVLVLLASVVALTAAACGSSTPGPDDVAIEWWTAFSQPDRDKLAQLTCRAKRPDLEMAMNYMAIWTDVLPKALGGLLGIGDIEVGTSATKLKAEVLEKDSTNAKVEVTGNMRMAAVGISGVQEFRYPMSLIMEDEQWVVCDDTIASIVNQITGLDQFGMGLPGAATGIQGQAMPGATLSVEQAVRATIEADNAAKAIAAQQTIVALTPTATSTPTPMSEEDRQQAIVMMLARETIVAGIGERVTTLEPEDGYANNPAIFLDSGGRQVATTDDADFELKIWIWDVGTGQKITTLVTTDPTWCNTTAALSPDGQTIATACGQEQEYPKLWSIADGRLLRVFQDGHDSVSALAFSPDGTKLATMNNLSVALWNVENGSLLGTFTPSDVRLKGIVFSPDGQYLAVSDELKIHLLEASDGSFVRMFGEFDNLAIDQVALDPNGRLLGATYQCGGVKLWTIPEGEEFAILEEPNCYGGGGLDHPIAFSPDGQLVVAPDSGNRLVKLWSTTNGEHLRTSDGGGNLSFVTDISFSPDGNVLAVIDNGPVTLLSVQDGQVLAKLGNDFGKRYAMFSNDGRHLITAFPIKVTPVGELLDSLNR